jgi:hypothetical protein
VPVLAPATHGEGGGAQQTQVVYIPLKLPLDSARHAPGTARGYNSAQCRNEQRILEQSLLQLSPVGDQMEQGHPGTGRPFNASTPLILLLANFLSSAFSGQRGLYALLFTGFQVKGVTLDLFDNIFLLHFALEAAQRIFEGFPLLQPNFRQTDTPPNPSGRTQ